MVKRMKKRTSFERYDIFSSPSEKIVIYRYQSQQNWKKEHECKKHMSSESLEEIAIYFRMSSTRQ